MAETLKPPSEDPVRRPRRFEQPEALARLRPSQARAAQNREARERQHSTGYWLRRLGRPRG